MDCIHQVGPRDDRACSLTTKRGTGPSIKCDGDPECRHFEKWDGTYRLVASASLVSDLRLGHEDARPSRRKRYDIRNHPRAVKAWR